MSDPQKRPEGGRNRLIRAGMKLFAERGYAGTGVREIAAEAGVSQGLIRRHFGSKVGLREAIEGHVLAEIEQLYGTIAEHSGSKALERIVDDAAQWVERDRDALMFIRMALLEKTPGSQKLFDRLVGIVREFVTVNRERGFLQDDLQPDDEEQAVTYFLFFLLGPIFVEPFARSTFGSSMYERSAVQRRNAFSRRLLTQGVLKS